MFKRNLISTTVLAIILLAGYRFIESTAPTSNSNELHDSDAAVFPQAFYTDLEIVQFNLDGNAEQHFVADELKSFQLDPRQRSEGDYIDITSPAITFFQTDGEPWHLQAEQGKASQNLSVVELSDNVHIRRQGATNKVAEVETDQLTINTETQFGHTDKTVTIRHPDAVHTGVGMEVEFEREKFTLLSQVRSRYEPEPSQ